MEKISGILPSSPRIASVDMKEASPVRPGAPGFGRSEGVSSLRQAKIGETASRAVKISQDQLDWRSKDMKNAATVRELTDRFFQGNKTVADPTIEAMPEMNTAPLAAGRPSQAAGFDLQALDNAGRDEAQPEGLHPRGSFLDVSA